MKQSAMHVDPINKTADLRPEVVSMQVAHRIRDTLGLKLCDSPPGLAHLAA